MKKQGGSVRVSIASKRRQSTAAADAMTRGWGMDWIHDNKARSVHDELMSALQEEEPASLVGSGLTRWKGGAINAVKLAKQATAIDIRQATGSPSHRFGVPPTIPVAVPQTSSERTSARVIQANEHRRLYRSTHGVGANTRGVAGVPYNIEPFRRPQTKRTGGALMSSGVPIEETMPARNMKSALDLEDLVPPIEEPVDVLYNVGGSDAPIEDWTNPGMRHSNSGMRLFSSEGPRL